MATVSKTRGFKYHIRRLIGGSPFYYLYPSTSTAEHYGYWCNAIKDGTDYYLIFGGDDVDIFARKWDGCRYSATVKVAERPDGGAGGNFDGHKTPGAVMSDDGKIHVFYGCHMNVCKYSTSTNARDITSWTDTSSKVSTQMADATYPLPFKNPSNGNLYVMFRDNVAPWKWIKSIDNGVTWSSATSFLDTNTVNYPETCGYLYINGHYCLGISWKISSGDRYSTYFAYFDMTTEHMYSVDGTDLGTTIDETEAQDHCTVWETYYDYSYWPVSNGNIFYIPNHGFIAIISGMTDDDPETYEWFSLEWTGTEWGNKSRIRDLQNYAGLYWCSGTMCVDGGTTYALLTETLYTPGPIYKYSYNWSNHSWTQEDNFMEVVETGASGVGWMYIRPQMTFDPNDSDSVWSWMLCAVKYPAPYYGSGLKGGGNVFCLVQENTLVIAMDSLPMKNIVYDLHGLESIKLYLKSRAADYPQPTTAIGYETFSSTGLGAFSLPSALTDTSSVETSSELFEQQMKISTSYPNLVAYDFDPYTTNSQWNSVYPLVMEPNETTDSSAIIRTNETLIEPGMPHAGWVKTFVSTPLDSNYIFSSSVVSLSYKGYHEYSPYTTDSYQYPRIRLLLWGADDSYKAQLFDGTSSISAHITDRSPQTRFFTKSMQTYFSGSPIETTVTASAGDKLVVELSYYDDNYEAGGTPHAIAFGGIPSLTEDYDYASYLNIHTYTFSAPIFRRKAEKTLTSLYNTLYQFEVDYTISYDISDYVSRAIGSRYRIYRGGDYVELETTTALRGRSSIKIKPEVQFPDIDTRLYNWMWNSKNEYYGSRFPERRSTMNKYHMIEDFENYESLYDMTHSGKWIINTSSVLEPYNVGGKHRRWPYIEMEMGFPETINLKDYNVLSILGVSTKRTMIRFQFMDINGHYSMPVNIAIDNQFGRYESNIVYSQCNPESISALDLYVQNAGDVTLDDIVCLNMRDETKYKDWCPMNLVDINYERQSKVGTMKIPYKIGEEIQYHGEYAANGSYVIKTFDNRETLFLSTIEREHEPIYIRAKHFGFPVQLASHETIFTAYGEGGVKTDISVDFVEIYNSDV